MNLIPEYRYYMPPLQEMREGILYVSMEFELCIHLCACGCGQQSVTPFNQTNGGWNFTDKNGFITLHPSILNYGCNAHYFLIRNEINWC